MIQLRAAHGISQGKRTDLPHDAGSSKANLPHDAGSSGSWPVIVAREVGISDDTARRWMKAAANALLEIHIEPKQFLTLKENTRAPIIDRLAEVVATKQCIADMIREKPVSASERGPGLLLVEGIVGRFELWERNVFSAGKLRLNSEIISRIQAEVVAPLEAALAKVKAKLPRGRTVDIEPAPRPSMPNAIPTREEIDAMTPAEVEATWERLKPAYYAANQCAAIKSRIEAAAKKAKGQKEEV